MRTPRRLPIGAEVTADGVSFRVWAPGHARMDLVVADAVTALASDGNGYFEATVAGLKSGARYGFRIDGEPKVYPDPASRYQPDGPHGLSTVVDPSTFVWTDAAWPGATTKGQVVYEMHVGTFTREGTYASAVTKLAHLAKLGVTVIELMPLAEFEGSFGWGYDGVDWFAPTRLYGDPDALRSFVDRAHAEGISVILDVVYNHLGPDGNYLKCFSAAYFDSKHSTDWGEAVNFDGALSAGVREYVLANVRYWIDEFHLDGLRVDATQDIHDISALHILHAISDEARAAAGAKSIIIVAENEPQDANLVRHNGYDLLWNDDFHHSIMVAATGHAEAYYKDYEGTVQELMSAVKWGYLYQGQYYAWQKQRRGSGCLDVPATAFVNFTQNHDQVANSLRGQRLTTLSAPSVVRALTALHLLAPGTPMLFQGQELGAKTPFFYFADHAPELASLVRKGRLEFLSQFASIEGNDATQSVVADPSARATFDASKLDWDAVDAPMLQLHTDLLTLRRTDPTFSAQAYRGMDGAVLAPECLVLRFFGVEDGVARPGHADDRLLILNLGRDLRLSPSPEPLLGLPRNKAWEPLWSSEDIRYSGQGMRRVDDDSRGWMITGQSAVVLHAVERANPLHTKATRHD